ncbi:hypothetical protein DIPPA_18017 [Diplonema papillatum]|nr:hypothetical protein DIPPA_18017 [Diplonema papillatum]
MPAKRKQSTLADCGGVTNKREKEDGDGASSPKRPRVELKGVTGVEPQSLAELFAPFKSGLEGSYSEQQQRLHGVAATLMNRFVLVVKDTKYRLAELEAYVYHKTHPDVYVHKDPDQLVAGSWYFHRAKGSYKGGTYKGMDLGAGHKEGDDEVYVGFLVRAIQNLEDEKEVIEGPCLVVNRILQLNNAESIMQFTSGKRGDELRVDRTEGLVLRPPSDEEAKKLTVKPAFAAPRVGLTLRESMDRPKYCARSYRFSIVPARIGKFRAGFLAAAVAAGAPLATVVDEFGFKPKLASSYHAAALEGLKSNNPSKFYDVIVNNTGLCEMVGACQQVMAS